MYPPELCLLLGPFIYWEKRNIIFEGLDEYSIIYQALRGRLLDL